MKMVRIAGAQKYWQARLSTTSQLTKLMKLHINGKNRLRYKSRNNLLFEQKHLITLYKYISFSSQISRLPKISSSKINRFYVLAKRIKKGRVSCKKNIYTCTSTKVKNRLTVNRICRWNLRKRSSNDEKRKRFAINSEIFAFPIADKRFRRSIAIDKCSFSLKRIHPLPRLKIVNLQVKLHKVPYRAETRKRKM